VKPLEDYTEEELRAEISKRKKLAKIQIEKKKALLLKLFAKHFEENVGKPYASSTYSIKEVHANAKQGSKFIIEIDHYGVENYYGKEIADLVKEILGGAK